MLGHGGMRQLYAAGWPLLSISARCSGDAPRRRRYAWGIVSA